MAAGARRSSRRTGGATTRRCCSTCWRSASPTYPVDTAGVERVDRHVRLGHVPTARSTWTSRRCSATSTPTCGSTSAASGTSTCGRRASTTSRTPAGRRYSQRDYAIAESRGLDGLCRGVLGADRVRRSGDTTRDHRRQAAALLRYAARGAAFDEVRDDGTLVPTAAGGSVPFAPEITVPALVAMREKHGDPLFGRYGFLDAFNPTLAGSRHAPTSGRAWPAAAGTTPTISASTRGRS